VLRVALGCAAMLVVSACAVRDGDEEPTATVPTPAALASGPASGPGGSPTSTTSSSALPSGTPTAAEPAVVPPVVPPVFTGVVGPITTDLAARMGASWRRGCPVPLSELRYLTVSYVTFEGATATGELVVHADVADAVVTVFAALFAERYPIRSLRLVDDFGADDDASMAADNTSAFNCRAVTGGTGWSEHAYGRAIDLNPVENPYVLGRHVAPDDGAAFTERPEQPGVIHHGDAVVQAFAAAGWSWGGDWERPIDYQHFSLTGR